MHGTNVKKKNEKKKKELDCIFDFYYLLIELVPVPVAARSKA